MKFTWTFLLLFFLSSLFSQTQISGIVFEKESGFPLSYASVHVPNTLKGTITNENGFFEINLDKEDRAIVISYLGYEDELVEITNAKSPLKIQLRSRAVELSEIVVRSLSPLEYIQAAVAAYPSTINNNPFLARGFFREKSSMVNDNSGAYNLNEAVFKSYIPSMADTSQANQNQLVLFRETNEGKFRSILLDNKKIKKRLEKETKKGKRDGEITDEEMEEEMDIDINGIMGGGPADVLQEAQTIMGLAFLQEKYFKKIEYTFGQNSFYKNRDLIVVDFVSKRKIEMTRFTGSIYLDYENLAIVAVQYDAAFKVPFLINALIKSIVGISIEDITQKVSIKNQVKDNFWYPKELVRDISITLVQKKEPEVMSTQQLFSIDEIITDNPQPIDETFIFDPEGDYQEQVHPIPGLDWSKVNVIK